MRYRILKLIVFVLIGIGLSDIHAQSLYVKEYDSSQTAYSLSSISKLSFSSASLIISQTDNSTEVYFLNSLRYLSFSDSISVNIEADDVVNHDIKMYPNPVYNELKVDLSNASCPNGTLNILSMEGKLLKTEQITGLGIVSVDLSHLPGGFYICYFSNEAETKAVKIIKQ